VLVLEEIDQVESEPPMLPADVYNYNPGMAPNT
jgi:hypothetical protein